MLVAKKCSMTTDEVCERIRCKEHEIAMVTVLLSTNDPCAVSNTQLVNIASKRHGIWVPSSIEGEPLNGPSYSIDPYYSINPYAGYSIDPYMMVNCASTRHGDWMQSKIKQSKIKEEPMNDEFEGNVGIPVRADNFEEFYLPEGDAVEKAQHMNHVLRAKRSSLVELRSQNDAKIREYQFANSEIDRELGS